MSAGAIGGAVLDGWLGDTIGGAIYDGISSLGDKESSKDKVPSQDDLYSSAQQPVDMDKAIDKAVEKAVNKTMEKYKGIEDRLSSIETQHTVRIVIDGKIEGMSKDNENEYKLGSDQNLREWIYGGIDRINGILETITKFKNGAQILESIKKRIKK